MHTLEFETRSAQFQTLHRRAVTRTLRAWFGITALFPLRADTGTARTEYDSAGAGLPQDVYEKISPTGFASLFCRPPAAALVGASRLADCRLRAAPSPPLSGGGRLIYCFISAIRAAKALIARIPYLLFCAAISAFCAAIRALAKNSAICEICTISSWCSSL